MKSSLPKCECGADVHYVIYHVPHYDDNDVETVEEEYGFWSTCTKCFAAAAARASSIKDESELPF